MALKILEYRCHSYAPPLADSIRSQWSHYTVCTHRDTPRRASKFYCVYAHCGRIVAIHFPIWVRSFQLPWAMCNFANRNRPPLGVIEFTRAKRRRGSDNILIIGARAWNNKNWRRHDQNSRGSYLISRVKLFSSSLSCGSL